MDNMPDKTANNDMFEQAIARRVARLATMPVDTSRLDSELRRRIGQRA